jgi:hypothetical protein
LNTLITAALFAHIAGTKLSNTQDKLADEKPNEKQRIYWLMTENSSAFSKNMYQ